MKILLLAMALSFVQYPTKAEDVARNASLVKKMPKGTIPAVRTANNYGTDKPVWVCTNPKLKVATAPNGAKVCVKK